MHLAQFLLNLTELSSLLEGQIVEDLGGYSIDDSRRLVTISRAWLDHDQRLLLVRPLVSVAEIQYRGRRCLLRVY